MDNKSDFLCDVLLHISEVKENLEVVSSELKKRGLAHDRTKLQELEFDAFVSTREKFKKANYGSKTAPFLFQSSYRLSIGMLGSSFMASKTT